MGKSKDEEASDDIDVMGEIEHVLKRSDTYVGSRRPVTKKMWIYDNDSNSIVAKKITFTPAFYKIFDEIVVNAMDHSTKTKTCTKIKVDIDRKKNTISVYNNGTGFKCEYHKKLKDKYIAEVASTVMRSSSNYKDGKKVKRTTGGKNGIGMKATCIFSKVFTLASLDGVNHKLFTQKSSNNMYKIDPPVIKKVDTSAKPYTKVTFKPDLERFGMTEISKDVVALLKKRVFDLSVTTNKKVAVYYNGEKIATKTFKDYVDLYYKSNDDDDDDNSDNNEESDKAEKDEQMDDDNEEDQEKKNQLKKPKLKKICKVFNDRWEVCVVYDPDNGKRDISFVNGISTYKGGAHVDYIKDQLVKKLSHMIKKKDKTLKITSGQIEESITLFVKSTIDEPDFDSQVKDYLVTQKKDFGSTCELDDKFVKSVAGTGLLADLLAIAKFKQLDSLKKTDSKRGSLNDIYKLEDAEWAGKKGKSHNAVLILTEGDSAKTFAMSGLTVAEGGRKKYGVFPLRGKILNVRDVKPYKIVSNEEIRSIKRILGLKQDEDYTNTSSLRYGHIAIMTDSDHDGEHIKGLIINFIHYFWPSLLINDDFIQTIQTPLLKIFKKGKKLKGGKETTKVFYSQVEYDAWKENEETGWSKPKYYKGLGTSSSNEAKEIFRQIEKHIISFKCEKSDSKNKDKNNKTDKKDNKDNKDNKDKKERLTSGKKKIPLNANDKAILLGFHKKKADKRKVWIRNHDPTKQLIFDKKNKQMTYPDFINYKLIQFSVEDNKRSLPSMIDGYKPSQRKIMHGAFIKKLDIKEAKLTQLCGGIMELCNYHHGETSLYSAIVKMAQNFVGSNNINLLTPSGQFGSRSGDSKKAKIGMDYAQPRYISTAIEDIAKYIIREEDEPVLKYICDEGEQYEPEVYAPIIPMVLVNGTNGIGTGFSTGVPCYNPKDLIKNIKLLMKGKDQEKLIPWYRGFQGKIIKNKEKKKSFIVYGKYKKIDNDKIKITELPVEYSSMSQKLHLLKLSGELAKKTRAGAKTPVTKSKGRKKKDDDGKEESTKKKKKTYIFGSNYGCAENKVEIDVQFHPGDLDKLMENEDEMLKKLRLKRSLNTSNMYLFDADNKIKKYNTVNEIIQDHYDFRLKIYSKRRKYWLKKWKTELELLTYKVKFINYYIKNKITIKNIKKEVIEEKLKDLEFPKLSQKDGEKESYKYLLDMPIRQLTKEKVDELKKKFDEKFDQVNQMKELTPESIWLTELNEFENVYDKWLADWEKELEETNKAKMLTTTKRKNQKKKKNSNLHS